MFSLSLIMCYLTNGESTHTHTHVYKRLYLKLMALCTILIFLCGCTEFKPSGTEEYENDEMQQAMNHYTMQFIIKSCFILFGVYANSIDRNKNIANDLSFLDRIVECDDVCKIIMF